MNAQEVAADQLRSICDRILRLHEDRKAIADDIKDVYGEAKANGFDTKVLKAVVAKLGKPALDREEFDAIFELYWDAVNSASRAGAPARGLAA